jgi:Regulator of chromosome condensation (RCC1) repeat
MPAAVIAAGDFYSLIIDRDGKVWAWGDNSSGEFGNGTRLTTGCTCSATPVLAQVPAGMTSITAGPLNDSVFAVRAPAQRTLEPPPGAPNVIIVLLDDLGYSDIGPFGAEISTPTLNALAERACASPTITPLLCARPRVLRS